MTTSIPKQSSEHVSRRNKHKVVYRPLLNFTITKLHLYVPLGMRRLTKDKTGEVVITASS